MDATGHLPGQNLTTGRRGQKVRNTLWHAAGPPHIPCGPYAPQGPADTLPTKEPDVDECGRGGKTTCQLQTLAVSRTRAAKTREGTGEAPSISHQRR